MSYFMVDVEADGPIPGEYSMVCLGVVIVDPRLNRTFYGRISNRSRSCGRPRLLPLQDSAEKKPNNLMIPKKWWPIGTAGSRRRRLESRFLFPTTMVLIGSLLIITFIAFLVLIHLASVRPTLGRCTKGLSETCLGISNT